MIIIISLNANGFRLHDAHVFNIKILILLVQWNINT